MKAVKALTLDLVPWLLVVAAVAVAWWLACEIGSTSGPMAPRKWDGRYHAGPGPVRRSDRWRQRRADDGTVPVPAQGIR